MSELKTRIDEAIKAAMRAGEKTRLGTLRLVSAAIKQREIDERIELADADVLAILARMIKQRQESIGHFEQAGRTELVEREQLEIGIISEFLPEPLSDTQTDELIAQAIAEAGASTLRDMGKVMNILRPKLQGRADPASVSSRVRQRLGG
jgi:uncharacterized protein YqeY